LRRQRSHTRDREGRGRGAFLARRSTGTGPRARSGSRTKTLSASQRPSRCRTTSGQTAGTGSANAKSHVAAAMGRSVATNTDVYLDHAQFPGEYVHERRSNTGVRVRAARRDPRGGPEAHHRGAHCGRLPRADVGRSLTASANRPGSSVTRMRPASARAAPLALGERTVWTSAPVRASLFALPRAKRREPRGKPRHPCRPFKPADGFVFAPPVLSGIPRPHHRERRGIWTRKHLKHEHPPQLLVCRGPVRHAEPLAERERRRLQH